MPRKSSLLIAQNKKKSNPDGIYSNSAQFFMWMQVCLKPRMKCCKNVASLAPRVQICLSFHHAVLSGYGMRTFLLQNCCKSTVCHLWQSTSCHAQCCVQKKRGCLAKCMVRGSHVPLCNNLLDQGVKQTANKHHSWLQLKQRLPLSFKDP